MPGSRLPLPPVCAGAVASFSSTTSHVTWVGWWTSGHGLCSLYPSSSSTWPTGYITHYERKLRKQKELVQHPQGQGFNERCVKTRWQSRRNRRKTLGTGDPCFKAYWQSRRNRRNTLGIGDHCFKAYWQSRRNRRNTLGTGNHCFKAYRQSRRNRRNTLGTGDPCFKAYRQSRRNRRNTLGTGDPCFK